MTLWAGKGDEKLGNHIKEFIVQCADDGNVILQIQRSDRPEKMVVVESKKPCTQSLNEVSQTRAVGFAKKASQQFLAAWKSSVEMDSDILPFPTF